MGSRIARALGAGCLVLLGLGCGSSAPSRFYTLDSTATTSSSPPASYGVLVGPVSVPGAVDRAEFVVQIAPNRVEIEEFHRWAAPLSEGIARTVAGDLTVLLGTPDVAVAPFANFEPAYRVTIDVQRFESKPGESVLVEAVWTVRSTTGGAVRSGRSVAREDVGGAGYEALAAAHSRAVAKLSADVAAAIRAAAAAS
jgi:uncharacterized lipoprotein YmbA